MRIANNISALSAFNTLSKANSKFQKTLQQLSSGLRINSAADDASGLAISEKMRSQIAGLDAAVRNTQDGISLLQTAEGGLEATTSILQRMRELSVQAANDVLTQQDRSYIQVELDQLKEEIDRIAKTTQFNKKKLLDGSAGALWSSSDNSVKAKIHGGLTGLDDFGQKVNPEGNYNIDIRAEPGKAQVLSGRMFASGHAQDVTTTETITETFTQFVVSTRIEIVNKEETIIVPVEPDIEEEPELIEININTGRDVRGASSGKGWNFSNGQLTITGNGRYKISGTGTTTTNHITVNKGVIADVYLENVNINTDNGTFYLGDAAFLMDDANVNLNLIGTNYLHSGYHRAALEAPQGSTLVINSAAGDGQTDGELIAVGGTHGSGIGGCCCAYFQVPESAGGNIIIRGGTITAKGGDYGAGIGGGQKRDAGTIEIYGGNVTAQGGFYSAGIGSSDNIGDSGSATVIIGGGTVTATGGTGAAGIGGGAYSGAGTIKIAPGLVGTSVKATGSSVYGLTAQDIGAGIGYQGGYTGYEGSETVPIPPLEATTREVTITVPIEVEVEDISEREVTLSEDVKYDETIVAETTIGDIINSSTTTTTTTTSRTSSVEIPEASFMGSGHEKLKIIQGDGKTAEVTLYSGDSMSDIAKKINDAIADTLGQRKYTEDATKFCTIETISSSSAPVYTKVYEREEDGTLVLDEDGNPIEKSEPGVAGTQTNSMLFIRSAIAGKAGEFTFSGSEALLKTLGLNEIQKSTESTYTISVSNAHTGQMLEQDVKVTGSTAHGLIADNVDVEFDPMAGIIASWDEKAKRYNLTGTGAYSATLHLADNTLMLQTGANEGEDFIIRIGDMSANSLGVDRVNVMSHERAARSITIIDEALDKVLTQRASIGSNQNVLEHTMSNLITSHENLTHAESRIRDADLAKAIMIFTQFNIIRQANISMLAQANQFPQSVLRLLGR